MNNTTTTGNITKQMTVSLLSMYNGIKKREDKDREGYSEFARKYPIPRDVDFLRGSYGRVHNCGPHIVKVYTTLGCESAQKEIGLLKGIARDAGVCHIAEQTDFYSGTLRFVSVQRDGGIDLRQKYLKPPKRVPRKEFIRIARQTLEALDYLHKEGIVHGDIKPENVVVDSNGKVSVIDLGLANKENEHGRAFTSFYRPPENILDKKICAKGDIWALGVTLFTLLANEHFSPVDDDSKDYCYQAAILYAFHKRIRSLDNISPEKRNEILEEIKKNPLPKESCDYISKLRPFDLVIRFKYGKERGALLIHLLSQMVQWDVEKRASAAELLKHRIFKEDIQFTFCNEKPRNLTLQISNYKDEKLLELDLSQKIPMTCFHIPRSRHPYKIATLKLAGMARALMMSNERPIRDGEKLGFQELMASKGEQPPQDGASEQKKE